MIFDPNMPTGSHGAPRQPSPHGPPGPPRPPNQTKRLNQDFAGNNQKMHAFLIEAAKFGYLK